MIKFNELEIEEVVDQTDYVTIYRMWDNSDKKRWIAKVTSHNFAGKHLLSECYEEYETARLWQGESIVKPVALERREEQVIVYYEDSGWVTLHQYMKQHRSDELDALLHIAELLVCCVGDVHAHNMMLNQFNPHYFVIDRQKHSIKLIDIRASMILTRRAEEHTLSWHEAGALPYMSPEQTGRIGLVPDYRSDQYAVGIQLYEWFAGVLPYEDHHVAELVYQHIAVTAEPVYQVNKAVPKVLSDIIAKSMTKTRDERYMSMQGLLADLRECTIQLRLNGRIKHFTIGLRDEVNVMTQLENQFNMQEKVVLTQVLQRVILDKQAEVVWLEGDRDWQRTDIVVHTLRQVVPINGYVVTCRSKSNKPYDVWLQVVEQLAKVILSHSQLHMEQWIRQLPVKLLEEAELLVEELPILQGLLSTPRRLQLSHLERQEMLASSIVLFLEQFMLDDHLLAIYIEDFHMCDKQSQMLLQQLLEQNKQQSLLVICSYEADGKTSNYQKLQQLIEQQQIRTTSLMLQYYSQTELKQKLKACFEDPIENIDEFTSLIINKTNGNPLYIQDLLKQILERQLITLDDSLRTWHWDKSSLQLLTLHDKVASTIVLELDDLAEHHRCILSHAAFLGRKFSADALAAVLPQEMRELELELQELEERRIVQQLIQEPRWYIFLHEQIYEQAYRIVPFSEEESMHWSIGWKLVEADSFQVEAALHHLNYRNIASLSAEHRDQLARMNVEAAIEASRHYDFQLSSQFSEQAKKLLDNENWSSELKFENALLEANIAYQLQQNDSCLDICETLLEIVTTANQKLRIYLLMIAVHSSRHNDKKVLELSQIAFLLLDFEYNPLIRTDQLLWRFYRLHRKLSRYSIEQLHAMPEMQDEKLKMVMKVFFHVLSAAAYVSKEQWQYCIVRMMELTLQHGWTPESAYSLMSYSMVLNFTTQQKKRCYELNCLAYEKSKPYPEVSMNVYMTSMICYNSWWVYERGWLDRLRNEMSETLLISGNLNQALYTLLVNSGLQFLLGYPISQILQQLERFIVPLKQASENDIWQYYVIYFKMLLKLNDSEQRYPQLMVYDDVYQKLILQYEHHNEDSRDASAIGTSLYLYYYFIGDYKTAQLHLDRVLIAATDREFPIVDRTSHMLYRILILKELVIQDHSLREQYVLLLNKSIPALKKELKQSYSLYVHKYKIALAERAVLRKQYKKAGQYYEQALKAAMDNGLVHDVGIIAESYSRFLMDRSQLMLAKFYLQESYRAFQTCGIEVKLKHLREQYGALLVMNESLKIETLDYESVMNSVRMMTEERDFTALLHKLMNIMMHNAGADYGALLFRYGEEWRIEGYGSRDQLAIGSFPLADAAELVPMSIISYVSRTDETLVLEHAWEHEAFKRDAYVQQRELKSVVCLPLMYQNKTVCVLYLENNLSSGVFTLERQGILKLLSSQCAVAIVNANLYTSLQELTDSLEEQVVSRTTELERSMEATSEAIAEMTVYAERNRIAQEIHDIVGHTLTSTIVQIEVSKRLITKEPSEASVRLNEAQELVRHSLSEIRNSVHMLREDKYYDIAGAITKLVEDTIRNTNVTINYDIATLVLTTMLQKKVLYHAIQEGLTNGIRHGSATAFELNIKNDGRNIDMSLRDNGIGANDINKGFGLKVMEDRVRQIQGKLQIDSEKGTGTILHIQFPCTVN